MGKFNIGKQKANVIYNIQGKQVNVDAPTTEPGSEENAQREPGIPAPRKEYDDFELFVGQKTGDGYPITVIASPAGEISTTLTLNLEHWQFQADLLHLEDEETNEQFFIRLGGWLFEGLFPQEVAQLYRASLGQARAKDKGLRIRLRIEPPEVSALPWEYLYDKMSDLFLAISPEILLVRYLQVPEPIRPVSVSPPLKVFVVISNPFDLAEHQMEELDAEKEKQVIEEALSEWEQAGLIQLEFLQNAIAEEIRHQLREFQPHVFHFIGHGAFREEDAVLVLEDDAHRCRFVSDRVFREFFVGSDMTKLVVLNACESAKTSSTKPLVGMAPQLVRRGLPAVVAMQYPIYDDTAIKFSQEFYRSLAVGFPVDAALTEARRGIYIDYGVERRDWGIPVLFMRAPDGVIFQVASRSTIDVAQDANSVALSVSLTSDDEKMFLRLELSRHKRNLHQLRLQKAIYATGEVPLRLLNQIEHEEQEIKRIEAILQSLEG